MFAYSQGSTLGLDNPDFPDISPGLAFWVLLSEDTSISVTGDILDTSTVFRTPISQGWNMVGSPWPTALEWSDDRVSVSDGTTEVSMSRAIANGWLTGNLFDYDGSNYSLIQANDSPRGQMDAWRGYLMFSQVDGELIFNPPGIDTTPPTVAIDNPVEHDEIKWLTDVVGTASDSNLVQYTLELASLPDGGFDTFHTANTSVTSDVLGDLDPTMLVNGLYRLRLEAVDIGGNSSAISEVVRIGGDAKLGILTLSFIDLNVPMAGVPLAITRNYDSRVKTSGDFGIGWNLDLSLGSYVNNPSPPGQDWQILPGALNIPCRNVVEVSSHLTMVKLWERESYVFEPVLTNVGVTLGGCTAEFGYQFVDGTYPGATLRVIGDNEVIHVNGTDFVTDIDFNKFDPEKVRLTTADGRVFDLDQDDGITRIQDRNGNSVSIGKNGITHSAGQAISFARDSSGRISQITDPLGQDIDYIYDNDGNLVQVVDRDGIHSTFEYDENHNLEELIDPKGNRAVRNEYDDDGRLIAAADVSGNRTEITHDLTGRTETITDFDGNLTVLKYDTSGNITSRTDALGNTTSLTYDTQGNKLTETDPLGNTTSYAYDSRNNLLSVSDPLGNTTSFTYNGFNRVLDVTDPLGNKAANTYDSRGNLTASTNALGETTEYSYDVRGNLTSVKDSDSNIIADYTYDSLGNLTSSSALVGYTRTFAHDSNGTRIGGQFQWVNPDDSTDVRLVKKESDYDALNRLSTTTDPDGNVFSTKFDENGQTVERTDVLGDKTFFTYDSRNRAIETEFPDGTITRMVYGSRDSPSVTTDRHVPGQATNGTRLTYDALGRLVETERLSNVVIDIVTAGGVPESVLQSTGAVISNATTEYDAAGRTVAVTNAAGATTHFEYDDAGRRTAIVDALGNRTEMEYDDAGQLVLVRDALGRETEMEYDAAGRRIKTIFPDNTFESIDYDARGNKASVTDQDGITRRFEYDAFSRLTAVEFPGVPDPENGGVLAQPRYEFDRDQYGTVRTVRDPKGRETHYTYDEQGTLLSETLPLGQTESRFYDNFGRLATRTDFKGQITEYVYGAFGRVEEKRLYSDQAAFAAGTPDETISYTYDGLGRLDEVIESRGATDLDYDSDNRLVSVTSPEGTINYEYDTATGLRVRTFTANSDTHYGYDALDRLETVTVVKRNGVALSPVEVTTYSYTAVGNREAVEYPNGTRTEYEYDDLNRPAKVTILDSSNAVLSSYDYTLAPNGLRLGVTETRLESDNSYSTTDITYTYDDLLRLTREASVSSLSEANFQADYTYDLVGNRLEKMTDDGTTVENITYVYDNNDRLLQEVSSLNSTTAYGYDLNGSLTSKVNNTTGESVSYGFNLENRLASATINRQEEGHDVAIAAQYVYDQSGSRVLSDTSTSVDGATAVQEARSYLMDYGNPTQFPQVLEEFLGGSGTPDVSYVLGDDVISQATGGGVGHLLYDGHTSTRLLTDVSGAITDRYSYDSYGQVLGGNPSIISPAATSLLYSGEQFDVHLQQQYLRSRYYDTQVGRFNRTDPLIGNLTDPQSLHKYAYAHGDPVNNIDPSGARGLLVNTLIAVAIAAILYLAIFNALVPRLGSTYSSSTTYQNAPGGSSNTPLKIAIIVGSVNGGVESFGWELNTRVAHEFNERNIDNLVASLSAQGHTVNLHTNVDEGGLAEILSSNNIVYILAPGPRNTSASTVTDGQGNPLAALYLHGTGLAEQADEQYKVAGPFDPLGGGKNISAKWVTYNEIREWKPSFSEEVEVIVDSPNSFRTDKQGTPYLMEAMNADVFIGYTTDNVAVRDSKLLDYLFLRGIKGLSREEAYKLIIKDQKNIGQVGIDIDDGTD